MLSCPTLLRRVWAHLRRRPLQRRRQPQAHLEPTAAPICEAEPPAVRSTISRLNVKSSPLPLRFVEGSCSSALEKPLLVDAQALNL
jgi:hypothetical protein